MDAVLAFLNAYFPIPAPWEVPELAGFAQGTAEVVSPAAAQTASSPIRP